MAELLYNWQKRYLADMSQFKLLIKAPQVGGSYISTKEVALDCVNPRRAPQTWIVMSAGDRQSKRLVEDKFRRHVKGMDCLIESSFFRDTSITQHEVKYKNGSLVICLPANPLTATGDTGNVLLDEFAKHRDSLAIFEAMITRATRGFWVRVLSTFQGTLNKFYELAKLCGLHLGVAPKKCPVQPPGVEWSGHWVDIHKAKREGLEIDIEKLRRAINNSDIWQQQYLCIPMQGGDSFFPLELIQRVTSVDATCDFTPIPGHVYGWGYDVGRRKNPSALVVGEPLGDVNWTRKIKQLLQARFNTQAQLLEDTIAYCTRGCIDQGGMGEETTERLMEKYPGRVEGVLFGRGTVKQDLAFTAKADMEELRVRIPDHAQLRAELNGIKKYDTPQGNIRLLSEEESTTGSHGDIAWAWMMMLAALRSGVAAASVGADVGRSELLAQQRDSRPSFWREEKSADYAEEVPAAARGIRGASGPEIFAQ